MEGNQKKRNGLDNCFFFYQVNEWKFERDGKGKWQTIIDRDMLSFPCPRPTRTKFYI
jgi:hypothetical protein